MKSRSNIKSRVLPLGWIVLWIGVGTLFLLGFILADGILITLSLITLLFFAISFLWGRLNLGQLQLSVDLPERVHAAKGFDVHTYVDNNKSWLNSYSIKVIIPILQTAQINTLAKWISAKNGAGQKERVSVPLRGITSELSGTLSSTFPFGLVSHQKTTNLIHPLIVYPRSITPIELLSCGSLNDTDPQNGTQFGESLGELRGIRDWQPGDSAKRIHWPASARSMLRGQGLRVREFDPPGFTPENCSIIFHSHAQQGEVFRQDRFERATSLAAGTLKYLHANQVKISLFADFLGWIPHDCESRTQYIEALCLLAHAKRSISTELHDLQQIVNLQAEQSDQIILISDVDPDAWSDGFILPANALVIDIRQMKFQRRGFDTRSKAS